VNIRFFLFAGLTCISLSFLFFQIVFADELVLNNGDRLTGTLIEAQDGKLTFHTDYTDKIILDMEAVKTIITETPMEVRLESDEVLVGPLRTEQGAVLVGGSANRQATVVDWERVKTINVPDALWEGSVWFGGTQHLGNTDRMGVSFGAEAVRTSEKNRWNFSFLYNYAEEDDELVARDAYGLLKFDQFFTRRFYGYLAIEMLKDEFKELNLRTVVGPGIGYQLWDAEKGNLALEAGVAYFSEDRTEEDEQWFTARLAARFQYQVLEWMRFTDHLILYPQFESVGDYTLRNEVALITSFGSSWAIRFSNIWERDSDPAEGVKEDDFRTSANLQYTF